VKGILKLAYKLLVNDKSRFTALLLAERDVSTGMLRRGNASNFYVGAAATRGTGDLWNPRAMAGTPP
jgi:hypothetical protein